MWRKFPDINFRHPRKLWVCYMLNKNLEEQAQSIFAERFVNNDYEIAKVTNLGSVCDCVLGGTPRRAKQEFSGLTFELLVLLLPRMRWLVANSVIANKSTDTR